MNNNSNVTTNNTKNMDNITYDISIDDLYTYKLAILSLWPLGFLGGLTIIGILGAGFQVRFILPAIPPLIFIFAMSFRNQEINSLEYGVYMVFLGYCAMNCLFMGIMYAPLFADLDVSVAEVVEGVLGNMYAAPASREAFQAVLGFMAHFGLVVKAA